MVFFYLFPKPQVLDCSKFTSLPNDKFLDRFKFKAFACDILNAAVMLISLFDGVENYVATRTFNDAEEKTF